jgi:hypothetical protein
MGAPSPWTNWRPKGTLVARRARRDHGGIEPLITHLDVTTIMRTLDDIQRDVRRIIDFLEDEDGEEEGEVPEDDS